MERFFSAFNGLNRTVFVLLVFCGSFIASFFISTSLFAAEEAATLEEMVVTASRFEEKLTNVPANVTVINEERIRNSAARNIPDILRSEPGVNVSDTTGNGRYYTVDLRGFGETGQVNTLVLVDGMRVTNVDLSGTDWALIPLDRVQRIEIIRGGRGAVLYGDNASGGVINIITKDGGDKIRAGVETAAGSYNTYSVKAFAGGSPVSTMPFYVTGNYLRTDGYRDNSGLDAKDVGLNVNYLGIKDLRINIATGYHQDYNRMPGALTKSDLSSGINRTATKTPNDYAKIEDYYLRVTPEYFIANNISFKMDMSYRNRTNTYYYYNGGYYLATSGLRTVAFSPRATIKNETAKNVSNNLVVGADYQWSSNDIRSTSDYGYGVSMGEDKFRKKNYGLYLHDEAAIYKKLFLSAGYRWDRADYTFSPSEPHNSAMESNAWTAGLNYKYLDKSYAYLSYSKSFRNPVLDEFYSYDPLTWAKVINTSLKKQTSDSYEIGTRFYFKDDIYAHINLFRTDTRNEIFYNPAGSNENMPGMTRRTGLEFSFSAKVTGDMVLRGSYTYTDAEIRDGMYGGKQVPNVPEHKVGLEGQYSPFKGFTIVLDGTYVGERPFISDFSNAYPKQADYVLVNNRYQYKWKNYTVFMNINNLFNQKYSEYGTYGVNLWPSPGINFMGGVRVEI
jgi:iron complex outermembrane recepter protein